VLLAGRALRSNVLDVAAQILKMDKAELDIRDNCIVNKMSLETKIKIEEVGRVAYFRPDTLPLDFQAELTVTRHYTPRQYGFTFTNGIQASYVEVDTDTGFVKLLKHWCVEDSGTVINPMLVDEQLRGGVVQGIGAALYEECLYDAEGQMLNANMADYLVPMSAEMPDIVCAHVETPTLQSQLGAKGVGEAGTAGAPAAVMNAINDALSPLGARVNAMPFTPEKILAALKKI
jgi:carbon-monoxide dehydrogenase large subunit